jgi:hypothetical protein
MGMLTLGHMSSTTDIPTGRPHQWKLRLVEGAKEEAIYRIIDAKVVGLQRHASFDSSERQ